MVTLMVIEMDYEELLGLFEMVNKLKTTPRTGWVRCGVKNPESVADHIYRTSIISMFLSDRLKLDTCKIIKMALLHDLAEAVVGDITPHNGKPEQVKREQETHALIELLNHAPNNKQYIELWNDYIKQATKEAELVKNIDKLEMALQAFEYQKENSELDLSQFISDTEKYMTIPEIKTLYKIISQKMKDIKTI
jgi:5'-deoxynucleotidase YfbR-like HD superfamily hydrolase